MQKPKHNLAQQLSLAAQAANKIEDFKQPSLVFARSTLPFLVLRIQTRLVKIEDFKSEQLAFKIEDFNKQGCAKTNARIPCF